MPDQSKLNLNDIIVSQVEDGYDLMIVTGAPEDEISLVYRGNGWSVQYAVAKGARLATRNGGDLWYTENRLKTLEYLESFRSENRSAASAIAAS